MDGQIGEQINNSVLNIAVPAKRARLALSSEMVATCTEVTPELNRSSPPVTLPDKVRTVSSTDFPLRSASHSFDFLFVASDDEVRQLLVAETGDEHRDVALISHPDDLSQANLVSRLSISDDGRHIIRSGKLFESPKPLTLVMDIRKLSSEELPKFNDLLDPDNPCLYDKVSQKKRPLGEHVALLVLADLAQLASVGQSDGALGNATPGADFWRRINRPGNTWQFDAQSGNDQAMEINEVPPVLAEFPTAESAMDDDNTVLIDCHLHSHWRQLLLGGPGVDQQGRIQHIPGRLETLRAGQRVILKGADWQDLAFEQTIRQMLAQKSYESNGKICQLPDDIQFYQMPVGKDELHSLFQTLFRSLPRSLSHSNEEGLEKKLGKGLSLKARGDPIIINKSNIREWLSSIAITPEGYAVPNTRLLEQVRAGGVITVTSPLTETLWFRLLGSLQTISETTGLKPGLQVAHIKRQPKDLELAEKDEHSVRDHPAFNAVTYQQPIQASHWINRQQAPLVIQVNEQTSLSQLFDNIHISSEQKAHFGRRQTELQEALTSGKPVVLRGLESNPNLQQLLEPLVIGQPLLLNGQLQAYPKAHVTLLWPESAKSPSSLFNTMIATGKPCPEVDIWGINGARHDIPRAELPEQALQQLYEAFKTVPADLCNPLPEVTEGVLNNLILAARRAQQVDQSPQLLARHWRKAINSVITHGTRQNPSVRDFMKVVCWQLLPDAYKKPEAHVKSDEHQTFSIDPDRLTAIINSSLRLDREFVKQNLWQLARAFDPAVFKVGRFAGLQRSYGNPLPPSPRIEKEVLDRVCAMIVAHMPEQQREAVAHQLEFDPATAKQYHRLAIRPSRQIKRLQDALDSGWQLSLPTGQNRSGAIHALATDCFHVARGEYVTENSDAERIERIENRLSESLEWTGTADKPLSALARDLYHGEMSQKDRESRRLSRLHDRLADSPVIFLQGETGTGKSYFSARVAKASGQASVISLGPSDSEQTLMKRWQWQEHADGDRSMEQQNRMLMKWANTRSDKDGEYTTLVLDEANLTKAGLLSSLNGLWEPEPCIYVNGHPVKVSLKHRVILTGNPDHYAGRQLDPTLKEKLPRAYYPRLDRAFLRDRVVEPALVRQLQRHLPEPQINDIAQSATESVMALWQYYQELLPGHEFTPRDLTDICSWVGWYLDCSLPVNDSVSDKQINGLIQQAFRDVLAPEISESHQDALTALEIWFAARYEPDNTLSDKVHHQTTLLDVQQTFKAVTKQTRPDFDTSGSAVHELVQRLGQDLSRCQKAYHLNRKHNGRQATLVEGPAGRGKDATLNLVIESVKRQAEQQGETMPEVFSLNACDCSWDKVCEKIQTAKVHGGIVVISEMNLIDSQHLEGELNDILAGDAHPGFHLFATINPPEYSGRKPLSPALKGRFRHLPIRQYNPAELQTIAEKVLPNNPQGKVLAKQLTEKHCRLRACLQQKKLPLQPTSLDLQNVARAVMRRGDFSEEGLHQCLNQHYRLYLMAANLSLEELPESSAHATALNMALNTSRGELDSGLCKWFNQTLPSIDRPWLIRRSNLNSIDEKRHEIRIKADPDGEKARTEIISRVAQARWRSSGLSLKPNPSDDTLTRALYRHWQQSWFDRVYGQTGVDANCVFSLTEEEKQTLESSASQPYLREVDQRISAWNSNAVRLWPAFWHQISDVPNHWVEVSEQYIPLVHGKERNTLDRKTNFEHRAIPHLKDYKVFNTQDFPSAMYRWRAKDIDVTAEGEIKLTEMADQHIQGYDVLIPDPLPEYAREMTLASGTLATLCMSSDNGQYALPSLTPDDYIVALSIKPDLPFILTRDVYTGLHTLTLRRAGDIRSIQCAYVVEPREPDRIIPFREARSEQSTRSDTRCSEGMKDVLDELFETIGDQHRTEIHPPEIKALLLTIKNTDDTMQRIEAIKHYCKLFTGETAPEDGVNFFKFLVTQRQGSCRHRVPVFVAFCRYFGIPCRQIRSFIHSFAEYSGDGGQTWESVDLGGAPAPLIEITHDFLPIRNVGGFSNVSKNINALLKDLLKDADSAQQHALADACVISLEQLNKALDRNSAWPATNLRITNIINNLWERKDLTGLSMGVSLIQSLETKALGEEEMALISPVCSTYCKPAPMPEAVKQILAVSDEDQVTELLKSLYSKMIDQAGASPHLWLSSILRILQDSNLAKSSFIHFAREAMESGWLDPLPTDENNGMLNCALHGLLVSLEAVDELKVKAVHCLKKWYSVLLSREKSSRIWRLAYESFQMKEGETLFVTHCHDGFSPSLEDKIKRSSIQAAWTDQPKGIPNIERMLVHYPAFKQLTSGKANHRPVIIMGEPFWYKGVIHEKTEALFQLSVEKNSDLTYLMEKSNQYAAKYEEYIHALRICEIRTLLDRTNSLPGYVKSLPPHQRSRFQKEEQKNENDIKNEYGPILDRLELSHEEQKLFRDLKDICKRAIRQAFAHYLYEVTHSKGGCLTYCWVGASIEAHDTVRDRCGAYDPSSPEELYAMMSAIDNPDAFQTSVNNAYLREAFNASNALVLKSDELTEIAIEFSSSVNLNSICNSLYAGLMQ